MSATVTCPTQASPKYAAGVSRRDLPLQPPFTVDDLRNTIPAHCWERPLTKSFAYLAWDLLLVLVTGYLAYNYIEDPRVPSLLRIPLWGLYTFFQVRIMFDFRSISDSETREALRIFSDNLLVTAQ
jgi:hypothetical protein